MKRSDQRFRTALLHISKQFCAKFTPLKRRCDYSILIPRLGSAIASRLPCASSDITPGSTKPASSAGKQTLLLFLLEIAIDLFLVKGWSLEERGEEDNQIDAQESELSPEEHDTEEWEVDGDAINEGAENRGCTDLLRRGVGSEFAARPNEILVVAAIGLLVKAVGLHVAVGLRTPGGVLWRNDHSDGVVDGEDNESEENSCHQEGLGRSMALADLEDGDPEEANASSGNTNNGSGEEEQDKEQEEHVVDGEHLGRLDEDPVQRLEDVDVAKDVSAVGATDGVLGLVNASDEHASEDEEGEKHENEPTDELEGAEEGLNLDPGLDDPMTVFAARFGSKTFTANESALLADKSLEFAPVSAVQSTFASLIAALELSLALAIGLQLRGGVCGEGGG